MNHPKDSLHGRINFCTDELWIFGGSRFWGVWVFRLGFMVLTLATQSVFSPHPSVTFIPLSAGRQGLRLPNFTLQ